MKKFLSILLSAVMVLSLAACGAKEATPNGDQSNTVNEDGTRDTYVTIKVGTGHNKNSFFYTGLAEFERLVEENTKGAVQIDIFTDGARGSEGEMAEGLTMGTVDSGLLGSSSVAKLESTFNVFSLPYLFENNDHVDAVFSGEPGQRFRDKIWDSQHGMILDFWDSGFLYYSTNLHEINGPEDMKGMLIRIPDNPIQAATAAALGAATSTLSYNELYLACSNKTVDGQEGPVFAFVADNFFEVQKYMVLDGHIYTVMALMINGDVWEKLTAEDQEIVMQAAKDAGIVEKDAIRSSQAEQIKYLEEQGMIINENPDKQAWRDATASVYDQFSDTYGADLIDQSKNYPY